MPPDDVIKEFDESLESYISEYRQALEKYMAGKEADVEKREYSKEYLDSVLEKVKSHLPEWLYKELHKIAMSSAGGKAKARYAREAISDLGTELAEEAVEKIDINVDIISKAKAKQQVFGWFKLATKDGKATTDRQGDQITDEDLEDAAYSYVMESRDGGEMHRRTGVAKLIESMVFTKEKQDALGIDLGKTGWFGGFQVTDADVWKKVEDGEYSMFSIHGVGHRKQIAE